MSSDFLVWRSGIMKDGICKLRSLTGASKSFQIDDGVSRLTGWSADAAASMNEDYPKDIGLADSLSGASFLVVSGKVKAFLEPEKVGNIEFLPMKIMNHKGRVASEDYFVVNPLDIVDCIDKDASMVDLDPLHKDMISTCAMLVLKEDQIPKTLKVFRTKFWSGMIIIRRDLAQKMKSAGLTLLNFVEPEEYNGLF